MSEADSPNNEFGLPAFDESDKIALAPEAAILQVPTSGGEGWQTVDFPGAMSVDAIPQGHPERGSGSHGVIHYSNAAINPAATYSAGILSATPAAMTPVQALQAENAALRDRLLQVEHDLAQQLEWQQESIRILSQSDVSADETLYLPEHRSEPAIEQVHALEPSQERLHQLLQALERSQQTAQRQQILVETLTEQLESSQERVAQLERDCTLTQQRHNEQVQQVLQAESTCRDLRLRLHRQQQQTLQFKAALEKCLEMPTPHEYQALPAVGLGDHTAVSDPLSALLKPKHQPVKPWSLADQADQDLAAEQTQLPRPLFKLLSCHSSAQSDETELMPENNISYVEAATPFGTAFAQGDAVASPADPPALLDSDDPQFVTHLMQLIFPVNTEPSSYTTYTTADALQAEPLDLTPTSGTQNVSTESDGDGAIAPISPPGQLAISGGDDAAIDNALALQSAACSADPLWDDLAKLVDPSLTTEPANAAGSVDYYSDAAHYPDATHRPDNVSPTSKTGIPPLVIATHSDPLPAIEPSPLEAPTERAASSLTAWTWRDRLGNVGQGSADQAGQSTSTVRATQSPARLLAASATNQQSPANEGEFTPAALSAGTPSPIVYPLRYTRKLTSLAAVDLPTFPKR